ncbi:MAG: nucleoside triphosphate pyrophosphohydrolase [Moorellales bacterium]
MGKLWVVGLGPGDEKLLPPVNFSLLKRVRPIYLRTARHPVVPWLEAQGVGFVSFDGYYEEGSTFEEVYQAIVETLLHEAREKGEVAYAVPGHPLVAEDTVRRLLEFSQQGEVQVQILPAMSCLDAIFGALRVDPAEGVAVVDAGRLERADLSPELSLVVLQVYNRLVASEVKLALAPLYGDEWTVYLVRAAGVPGEEKVARLSLYEIDRQPWVDHLTSLYVPAISSANGFGPPGSLATLEAVMARLRGPQGCPWDRAQTHRSLRRYLLEECFETLEALDEGDPERLKEELGDLLLQVVFHARIAEEAGHFNLREVVAGLVEKLYRRHPHVFGRGQARTPEEVQDNWQRIKEKEKGRSPSLLGGVPRELPALARAQKLQERAAAVGFDWPEVAGVWEKLREEEEELAAAVAAGHQAEVEAELGDLLFAVVNLARFLKVDAEGALRASIQRFVRRFGYLEEHCRRQGRRPEELSLAEMDRLWEEAKARESKNFCGSGPRQQENS